MDAISAKKVAVIGCGPIGCMGAAVARTLGAAKIVAIELNPQRAQMALEMGADAVIDPVKEDVTSRNADIFCHCAISMDAYDNCVIADVRMPVQAEVAPESAAVKCDPSMPIEQLALMEPLGVAVHAAMEFPISAKKVAVIGCGPHNPKPP